MEIQELHTLTSSQVEDVLLLMKELNADIPVDGPMLCAAAESPSTHFFALVDGARIVGCASLCVCVSPTGRKAHVEDVVVLQTYRGQHLGRQLVSYVLDFARRTLPGTDIYLTSRPERVAANALYRSLGFQQKFTNLYKLTV